jgi:hypothetical protein
MNATLLKSLAALAPTLMLLFGSTLLYLRARTLSSLTQVVGAGCLVVVVLTHVCEALNLFPAMRWGVADSVGHYLDFWCAVLGLTLFPLGYLFHALGGKRELSRVRAVLDFLVAN